MGRIQIRIRNLKNSWLDPVSATLHQSSPSAAKLETMGTVEDRVAEPFNYNKV